jgi:hydroxyethylthiazole kinase-like sugar kinase family protein
LFRIGDVPEAPVVTGRIVAADALHTRRYVAQTIVDGDHVMWVNGNQPEVLADMQLLLPSLVSPNGLDSTSNQC